MRTVFHAISADRADRACSDNDFRFASLNISDAITVAFVDETMELVPDMEVHRAMPRVMTP